MKENFLLVRKNIFPYTRWSQISRIGKSLCLLKNIFCYREIIEKIRSKYNSLIFLAKPCPCSLLFGSFVGWWDDLCYCYGDVWGRILQVLFEYFSKGPGGFPYVFIIPGQVTTLKPVYGPSFVDHGSLSVGETSRFLIVLQPLKCVCIPYLSQIFLMLSQWPWMHGMTMWPLVFTSLIVGWVSVVPWLLAPSLTSPVDLVSLFSTLSKAQFTIAKSFPEMLHFFLEELRIATDCLALWVRVLMTLHFAERC